MTAPVLTPTQTLLSILVMAAVTFLTRVLPFLLFDHGDHPPRIILYLGSVLPPAIISMLIVYCIKGISFASPAGWIPMLAAGLTSALLHLWKRNNLISIFSGTVLYMILVQAVFA